MFELITIWRRSLLPLVVLVLAACTPNEPELSVGDVEYSGPAWSAESNLFAAPDGRIILTWLEPSREETHALRFAVRSESGWSPPATIHDSDRFFVNWADFPSLVELSGGAWVVHWLEKTEGGSYAYHVKLAISTDAGATWSTPTVPHRDQSPTEHGFVSMVPMADGSAALIWLDGRQMVGDDAGGEHEGLDLGEMSLRATTVTPSGEFGPDVLVDSRTCECCQTALVDAGSRLLAAYRDRGETEIRDIGVAHFQDDVWSEPRIIANDNFYYPGCPVNGPQLSASGDDVVIAWYTAPEQQARVYVAFSDDAGTSFSAPVRVDDGDPLGRVDVEFLADGLAVVSWLERSEQAADVKVRLVRREGWLGNSQIVSATSESRGSGFPRMAWNGSDVTIAWTLIGEDGGVRVATLTLTD